MKGKKPETVTGRGPGPGTLVAARTVTGSEVAACIAADFIFASAWVEVTPLPDDQYRFRFKDEGIGDNIIDSALSRNIPVG